MTSEISPLVSLAGAPAGDPAATLTRSSAFKIEHGRVCRRNDKGDWVPFCSEVNVLALTRNGDGEEWGRLLEIVDRDGNRHLWAMPLSMTAGSGENMRAELLRRGMELMPGANPRNWLTEYLISAEPERRARCVSRIGWHGSAYVLPDGAVGHPEDDERVILQTNERLDHAFNALGTVDEWRESVAILASGNSRLILSIASAFAAPLLALTGDEGGGFRFRGASSTGKTTALVVAGSVWGGGGTRGFVRQWRATDNALESSAALSCDNLLCLDELAQIDPKSAGSIAYMLANGQGKSRANREGYARRASEWRNMVLSSGEIGLADKLREGGGRISAGMEVRFIDLRADAGAGMGIFEDLHGAPNSASLAQSLKAATARCYGTAGREFVARVAENRDRFGEEGNKLRRLFVAKAVPAEADGQVRRVAGRFGIVAAAGEIATELGLTGWQRGAARDAALRCFVDWLQERGGIGSSEILAARLLIADAIQTYGASRFQDWNGPYERPAVRWGFVKTADDALQHAPTSTFYFLSEPLKNQVLAGLEISGVVEGLVAEGVIVSHKGKASKPFHVPSSGTKHRLYEINMAALGDQFEDG